MKFAQYDLKHMSQLQSDELKMSTLICFVLVL